MAEAEPFLSWIEVKRDQLKTEQNGNLELNLLNSVRPLLAQLIRGLACLHENGWVHLDVRPSNMVLLDGTARYIDWLTAVPADQVENFGTMKQGHEDPFWPTDQSVFISDPQKWDWYGFGYSIMFMGLTNSQRVDVMDVQRRDQVVSTIAMDSTTMASIGAKIIEHIQTNDRPVDPQAFLDIVAEA
jgi:serine/threonine protein kinase